MGRRLEAGDRTAAPRVPARPGTAAAGASAQGAERSTGVEQAGNVLAETRAEPAPAPDAERVEHHGCGVAAGDAGHPATRVGARR